MFSILAAGALLELGAGAIRFVYVRVDRNAADPLLKNPAYSIYPWARELREEQELRVKTQSKVYVPFRLWSISEWHGKYMNNDETDFGAVRRTIHPKSAACLPNAKTVVWLFGGSTVYGTNVPDWVTLPSYLSRELNMSASCTELVNFGVEGYVRNQETLVLLDELKAGRHPSIVIFYDGFNDSYAGVLPPGIPGVHLAYPTVKERVEGSLVGRLDFLRRSRVFWLAQKMRAFAQRRWPAASDNAASIPQARAIVDDWEANERIARTLAKAGDFKIYSFWQPALIYGRKPLAAFEKQMVKETANSREYWAMVSVYREAERRACGSRNFVFLGDVFERVREPLYLDWVHLNPAGNEIVARAIAESIRDGGSAW